jgi:hydroxymethylpyrimidine pyrophosphatase-like HAD family hydrolase
MIRFAVFDIEGVLTLPGGSQQPWPLEDMLAVRRFLRQSPVACVLCTGRQEPYGEAMIQALDLFCPLPDDVRDRFKRLSGHHFLAWPSILENGAYLYDPLAKRPIRHPGLTPEQASLLQKLRVEVLLPLVSETGAQLEPGKDFCVSINPPAVAWGNGERQSTALFRPVVEAALAEYRDQVEIRHSASAVDITPHGISKCSAVRLILEWGGLAPEEVLGVGDTEADEAWLLEVGWRAAPANGRDHLPGLHYYSPHEVAKGLLDILHRLEGRGYASV